MQESKKSSTRGVYEHPPGSGIYWINFFDGAGRRKREKIGTKSQAVKMYQLRKAQVYEGKKLPENLREVVRVSDLVPALLRDYRLNERKSGESLERRLRLHVLPFFASKPARDIGTDDINRYVDSRKREGAQNGTINREMAAMKRMFNLGRTSSPPKVNIVPVFPHLKEGPPRQGFLEDQSYSKLMESAQESWMKAILAIAYTFGFRRGELLLQMKVGQVDLANRTVRLYAGTTKNDAGRVIKMTGEVYELMRTLVEGKKPEAFVFCREDGNPVINFRGAWYALCAKAGLGRFVKVEGKKRPKWEGLLFHDLRRSAVRNMVRRGVPETVAMKISGHKTRSVFERYNIVSEADIEDAAIKIERGRLLAPNQEPPKRPPHRKVREIATAHSVSRSFG